MICDWYRASKGDGTRERQHLPKIDLVDYDGLGVGRWGTPTIAPREIRARGKGRTVSHGKDESLSIVGKWRAELHKGSLDSTNGDLKHSSLGR